MNSNQLPEKAKRGKRPFEQYYYSSSAPDLEMNRAEAQIWNRCIDDMAALIQQPVSHRYKFPDGWKLVPIEPTEDMIIRGFESKPDEFWSAPEEWAAYEDMSGCQQAAHCALLCWQAMLAAAPEVE
ncbi:MULTISPECIES: hypothetical protein [Pantoea]|uniref:hypothetical protein n=1 Tax=Pantoea TaxID=53335 RepID=UPI000689EC2E|nr:MULTISPECIES: hypothetical protein [Pantoea]